MNSHPAPAPSKDGLSLLGHNYQSPHALEPMLCNKRSHHNEKLHTATGEEPHPTASREQPTQQQRCSTDINNIIFFKKGF